jgi:hypothetical protein
MSSHEAPSALSLARLDDGKVVLLDVPGPPHTPRHELLEIWDRLPPGHHATLLDAARLLDASKDGEVALRR